MMHINKVKTFHGLKWSLVDERGFVVEYKGSNDLRDIRAAVFPLTEEGFKMAKELRKKLIGK